MRERRGSHSRVYQERDELHNLLQKSYLAFKEKHGENEQLTKIIQDLKENLRMTQEGLPKVFVHSQCDLINLCTLNCLEETFSKCLELNVCA